MRPMSVDEIADRLYALRPQEYTQARNQAERELRKAGEREHADQVKALRKPTAAAGPGKGTSLQLAWRNGKRSRSWSVSAASQSGRPSNSPPSTTTSHATYLQRGSCKSRSQRDSEPCSPTPIPKLPPLQARPRPGQARSQRRTSPTAGGAEGARGGRNGGTAGAATLGGSTAGSRESAGCGREGRRKLDRLAAVSRIG
jgi:hypothetical protein